MQERLQCSKCEQFTATVPFGGVIVCHSPTCRYSEPAPISFANDIISSKGQMGPIRRFNSAQTIHASRNDPKLSNTASKIEEDKAYRGKKMIQNCCLVLKYSQQVAVMAEELFYNMLAVIQKKKGLSNQPEQSLQDDIIYGNQLVNPNQSEFSVRKVSAYCVYVVQCQRGKLLEEYNIMEYFELSLQTWSNIVRQVSILMREFMDLPHNTPQMAIQKMCKKRHINQSQEKAMLVMCERVASNSKADSRPGTIAAICFWKVLQFSKRYHERMNNINLAVLCKSHDKVLHKGDYDKLYAYFDISPEQVRKVYRDHIKEELFETYLPDWEGKMQIRKANGQYINRD